MCRIVLGCLFSVRVAIFKILSYFFKNFRTQYFAAFKGNINPEFSGNKYLSNRPFSNIVISYIF